LSRKAEALAAIAIGGSAGAIEALGQLLSALPADSPPVLVVIHVPRHGKTCIADVFKDRCAARVKEAEDKEPIERGSVYFAPQDYHLLVEPDRRLSLSNEEQVSYSRPSITVLFESAAYCFGKSLAAIVLTGANDDGASGLRLVAELGGSAIVQDPETALASAMPLAAFQAVPASQVMPLKNIAKFLSRTGVGDAR
jgi:two-component system chemotaxis response regulator CheB